MNEHAQPSIGQRVAELRKLGGLTQAALAVRLGRSRSWVARVERGERQLDSMAVLLDLAQALAVTVSRLTGEHDTSGEERRDPGGAGLAELRRALARPLVNPAGTNAGPVADFVRAATELQRGYATSRHNFSIVLPALPRLLGQAPQVERAEPTIDPPRTMAAVVGLYRLAALEFHHWGDLLRARVAINRALMAAERSGDALLVAAVGVITARLMWSTEPSEAVVVADEYAKVLARDPKAKTVDGTVMFGALRSHAALAAACAGDEAEARRLRAAAAKAAETLGRDGVLHGVFFGPAVFASDETRYLVEFGHPREAARLGERIPLSRFSDVNRAGYHSVFLMQAHSMRGRDEEALAAVAAGLRVAPELLRDRVYAGVLTRSVVSGIVRRRRHLDERLRRIADHLDVHY